MKSLLLATVLLSTAMSDDILTKEEQRVSSQAHERQQQLWPKKDSWLSRDSLLPPGIDDFPLYATRVTPVLASAIVSKSGKYPPLPYLRPSSSRSTQRGSPNPADCKRVNPPLLVTLDFRRLLGKDDQFASSCNSEKCRRPENWELQSRMYVDEPHWIEIGSDYPDTITDRFISQDPFLLSRGKKFAQSQSNKETREKGLLDYDEVDDQYDGINMNDLLRRRRSALSWKQDEHLDRTEKMLEKKEDDQRRTGSRKDPYYSDYENIQAYKDPFFLTRGKKRIFPERRYQRLLDDRLDEIDARKFAIITKLVRGKRSVTSNEDSRTKESNMEKNKGSQEQTETTTHFSPQKLEDNDDSQTQFEVDWKSNEAFDFTDGANGLFPYSRGKRSNYESQTSEAVGKSDFTDQKVLDDYNEWMKDLEGTDRTSYVDRRDKHGDLKAILEQPFFISRGKKAAGLSEDVRLMEQRNEDAYQELIRELTLQSMINKIMNGKIVKKNAPRDRRGKLDDLLAKYDPFFVARGKRLSGDNAAEVSGKGGNSKLNSYLATD